MGAEDAVDSLLPGCRVKCARRESQELLLPEAAPLVACLVLFAVAFMPPGRSRVEGAAAVAVAPPLLVQAGAVGLVRPGRPRGRQRRAGRTAPLLASLGTSRGGGSGAL
eukprot:2884573-Heterocapsa_arctica.AAC.1